jgi:molecular chaperone DnaK (HSP70)
MASRHVVGIDLGTTHTVVAWAELAPGAKPEVFSIPQLVSAGEVAARPVLPSVLYAPPDGEAAIDPWGDLPWIAGEHARRRGQEVAGRTVSSAKSWLCHGAVDRTAPILPWGSDDETLPKLSPVEASARLLRHVARAHDEAFPAHPLTEQQVVLTVPASFDQAARSLTLDAARDAGLRVRLLEEPQAAFYDAMAHLGLERLGALTGETGEPALVLIADVGGGTTDLTLIVIARSPDGSLGLTRVAVGRHLLLGGDNMDLAIAHGVEARLVTPPARLDPRRFAQLVLACRTAKERLLGDDAPDALPIALAGSGSALVGQTLRAELGRDEVRSAVLDGFFPQARRDETPVRGRTGLRAFGLPYEHDPAITRHVAAFVARHAPEGTAPRAVLLNGGVFRAPELARRLLEVVSGLAATPALRLPERDPDLAVARGAVQYGLALAGHGPRIGGGAAHGYYLGIEGSARRAICVVPRGALEGERHQAAGRGLALTVGRPVRFELYSSDHGEVHAPGEVVTVEDEHFQRLPPVAVSFESDAGSGEEVQVGLEGELSPVGTLELAAVEREASDSRAARRFALAFELRAPATDATPRPSERPRASVRPASPRFDEARVAIERVFGKAQVDVPERAVKDLWRELARILGERETWSGELLRALFDALAPFIKARRRSPDHERVCWMLAGYCLRPGYGHPLDPGRIKLLSPLFEQGLVFHQEARSWQQFWIAWRRVAGGLGESLQVHIRDRIDPFLAPAGHGPKKPKGFKPQALDEMLELAGALERVPSERRVELGEWLLERTWSEQNPRLWAALGRLGSREPAYGSAHHVVPTRVAEHWLDHLLREKWGEVPTAPRAAMQLARLVGDRARDVREALRAEVTRRLEAVGADPDWVRAVREHVPVADRERAEFFGEELPVGLRLIA